MNLSKGANWICSLCGYTYAHAFRYTVTLEKQRLRKGKRRNHVCLDCRDKVKKGWYARDKNKQWTTNLEVVG